MQSVEELHGRNELRVDGEGWIDQEDSHDASEAISDQLRADEAARRIDEHEQ